MATAGLAAGGLVFTAATNFDRKFRAFDKSSGKLLRETTTPFSANDESLIAGVVAPK